MALGTEDLTRGPLRHPEGSLVHEVIRQNGVIVPRFRLFLPAHVYVTYLSPYTCFPSVN